MARFSFLKAFTRHVVALGCATATLPAFLGSTALAHEGDHVIVKSIADRLAGVREPVGSPRAAMTLDSVVSLVQSARGSAGEPLLPDGARLADATWNDRLLRLTINIPAAAAEWRIGPHDAETLCRALAQPFLADGNFAGIDLQLSLDGGPARGLAAFLKDEAAAALNAAAPNAIDEPILATHDFGPAESRGIGGPVANAARQPTGALSGVTVFIGAGHGWTAGASAWALQRPVLLGMNEDYGNIDQLNAFCAFAFNAGATVVPLRPAGWQPIQITIDQDDPATTYSGVWTDSGNPQFYENGVTNSGVAYRFSSAATVESATARYTPTFSVTDFYPVYTFVVASTNRVPQLYRIRHRGGVSEITVDHRNVGNGWVWLGNYYFVAGAEAWVEISNQSPVAGVVIADGIRFGGGFGDISRPGPNSISGYARDEEAQRYWAESELGNNAVGFASTIWDSAGLADIDDNIGTGARLAREMNQVPAGGVNSERWKRVHIEFHTNAFDSTARGQICLITNTGSTSNQTALATTLANEIDADMLILDDLFEHQWFDRGSPTLTSAYGAISTTNNSNEFDATIVEFAFHDNQQDAELLRDARVRAAMGKSCVQGVIRFLNNLPGSTVPLAFAPDTPRDVAVEDLGNGDVRVSWAAPLSNAARGDPATGYVIYQSDNGIAFGDPIVLGNVLQHTISGVGLGELRYFRIAATNAGGESMPSETLAVRRPTMGAGAVLVVNGFDRQRRQLNSTQTFTQPPAYNGQTIDRVIPRRSNANDYIIEHANALALNDYGFSSCSNDAVISGRVSLGSYAVVDWALGLESIEDDTLSPTEQTLLNSYLAAGGALFISGADIAFDLINQAGGASFATGTLQIGYSSNDANTFTVAPVAGSILAGLANIQFSPASGARFETREPDIFTVGSQGFACANYSGGGAGAAAVQLTTATYNAVSFGFPFEAIGSPVTRADVMDRVINFLLTATGPLPFDFNNDGDVDFQDFGTFRFCFRAPDLDYPSGNFCLEFDGDADFDVDIADFAQMQDVYTGP
ncbi:MAG: hypothetical protein SF069_03265 [Phycisphaerae bacterium]|nr:hypothetical protein [Phycisphaerae bacterium]